MRMLRSWNGSNKYRGARQSNWKIYFGRERDYFRPVKMIHYDRWHYHLTNIPVIPNCRHLIESKNTFTINTIKGRFLRILPIAILKLFFHLSLWIFAIFSTYRNSLSLFSSHSFLGARRVWGPGCPGTLQSWVILFRASRPPPWSLHYRCTRGWLRIRPQSNRCLCAVQTPSLFQPRPAEACKRAREKVLWSPRSYSCTEDHSRKFLHAFCQDPWTPAPKPYSYCGPRGHSGRYCLPYGDRGKENEVCCWRVPDTKDFPWLKGSGECWGQGWDFCVCLH